MNYFEFYVGDYARDTAHLTLEEHGAFLLLLAAYYGTERPLPAEIPALCRIARAMSASERESVKSVADQFFPIDPADGLRHNARADEVIAKARVRIDAARANGSKGGRPKKPNENPAGSDPLTQAEPGGKALQTPYTKEQKQLRLSAGADGCPHADIIALYHEALPTNPRIKAWTGKRESNLRARWREDEKRQSLDYWRRFFAHVAASPFLTGQSTGREGRAFLPGLDWLVLPENFAKVIEGRYHDRGET